ncbi:MAG: glycerate kinase [Bacteroidales bacterium]|nr:glycerate kinase [Bacteroidales bacterium]MBR4980724.1 glycerate kinase [Bacteroidales bacterium]
MESQNNPISKVVICSDKFKGGLSSLQVAEAVKDGLLRYGVFKNGEPSFLSYAPEFEVVEMADGGDGSAVLFGRICNAERIETKVVGPLGKETDSYYMFSKNLPTGEELPCAFIECATACGLAMVPLKERNPLKTTTYGVGQLIRNAVEKGAKKIWIGIGGSATNDCGLGMAQALGFEMEGVKEFVTGGNLSRITQISEIKNATWREKLYSTEFVMVNDVDNPLLGPTGATYIYSPQKGATKRAMEQMEEGFKKVLSTLPKFGKSSVTAQESALFKGAGAAGGLGFALFHFLGAEAVSGFEFFGNYLQNLNKKIGEAELIITGEGRVDNQSLMGKVVGGVTQTLSKIKEHKRLWVVCGKSSIGEEEIAKNSGNAEVKIYQLADIEPNMAARMKREAPLLSQLTYFAAMETDALL